MKSQFNLYTFIHALLCIACAEGVWHAYLPLHVHLNLCLSSSLLQIYIKKRRDLIAKRGEEEQGSVAALTANLVEMKSIPDPEDIAGVAEHEFYRSELQTKYNEIETLLLEKFARDVATLQKKHTDTCAAFGIDVEAEAAAGGSKPKTTLAADGDLDDDGDAIVELRDWRW